MYILFSSVSWRTVKRWSVVRQGDRADIPNVAVLITDQSSSTSSLQAIREAREAHCTIKIFAIGTRQSNFNQTELQLISSPPRLEYHQWWAPNDFNSNSFDNIQVMVDNELCRLELGLFRFIFSWFCLYCTVQVHSLSCRAYLVLYYSETAIDRLVGSRLRLTLWRQLLPYEYSYILCQTDLSRDL